MGVNRSQVISRVEVVKGKVGTKLKCVEIFPTLKGEFPKMTSSARHNWSLNSTANGENYSLQCDAIFFFYKTQMTHISHLLDVETMVKHKNSWKPSKSHGFLLLLFFCCFFTATMALNFYEL